MEVKNKLVKEIREYNFTLDSEEIDTIMREMSQLRNPKDIDFINVSYFYRSLLEARMRDLNFPDTAKGYSNFLKYLGIFDKDCEKMEKEVTK